MNYALTLASRNEKIGPMPVATITKATCPTSCPFKDGGGCYAEHGPLQIHWKGVTEGTRGKPFDEFVKQVSQLPPRITWRYGQAGDLPGEGDKIDRDQLMALTRANRGRPVIAYTHKPLTEENVESLKEASAGGFHVNISTEDFDDCDKAIAQGFSAVVVLPADYQRGKDEPLTQFKERTKGMKTPAGHPIAICPATYTDTNCQLCEVCSKPRARNAVVGFPAHGTRKKIVSSRLKGPF